MSESLERESSETTLSNAWKDSAKDLAKSTTGAGITRLDLSNVLPQVDSTSEPEDSLHMAQMKADAIVEGHRAGAIPNHSEPAAISNAPAVNQNQETRPTANQLATVPTDSSASQSQELSLGLPLELVEVIQNLPSSSEVPEPGRVSSTQWVQSAMPQHSQVHPASPSPTNIAISAATPPQSASQPVRNLDIPIHAEITKASTEKQPVFQTRRDDEIVVRPRNQEKAGAEPTGSKPADVQTPNVSMAVPTQHSSDGPAMKNSAPKSGMSDAPAGNETRQTTASATHPQAEKAVQKSDPTVSQTAGVLAGQSAAQPPVSPSANTPAASAVNILPAPNAASASQVTATPVTTPSSDAHDAQPAVLPITNSLQIHAAHIVQAGSRAEMRLDMRTQAFGGVEIHTAISGKDVQLVVSAEHGNLRSFLAPEMPVLQSSLQQHDLRLEQVRTFVNTGTQPEFSSGSGRQEQNFSRPRTRTGVFYQSEDSSGNFGEEDSPKGLSIRI